MSHALLATSTMSLPFKIFKYIINVIAHCSYLNTYISQKIRLCVVDLEGKYQTTLQAKPINFLIWKFRSIVLIFLFFNSCQIQCILHTVDAIPKRLNHLSQILEPNCNSSTSTLYLCTYIPKKSRNVLWKKNMPKMQNWPH